MAALHNWGHTKARKLVFGAIAAAALLLVSPCDQAAAQGKRKITFGLSVGSINASYCMFPTAIRAGFFADEGLDVTVQPIPGSITVVQTVLSGRLDIGGTTPEPLLQMFERGNDDLVMVYDFIRRPTGSIAVLDDSPIKKFEDFKGKKLGAQSLASANILLTNGVLSKFDINPKTDLTYLAVGVGAQALQALTSHRVDGLAIFDSVYAQMEAMGAKLRYFVGPEQDRLFAVQFIVRKTVAKSDPDLIKRVGRAIAKATFFASINPEACVRMMWKEVPASRTVGVDEQVQLKTELSILKRRLTLLITPDSEVHGFGYYNSADVEAWSKFALEGDLTKQKVDLTNRFTNEFVSAYNNFDHAAVARQATNWHDN